MNNLDAFFAKLDAEKTEVPDFTLEAVEAASAAWKVQYPELSKWLAGHVLLRGRLAPFKPSYALVKLHSPSVEVEECKSLLASIPFETVPGGTFPVQIKRWSIYDDLKHLLFSPTLDPSDKSWRRLAVTETHKMSGARVPSNIKLVSCMPWFCSSSPQCAKRKNDIGYACYHCGAKEK